MKRALLGLGLGFSLMAGAQERDEVIDLQSGIGPITFDMVEDEIRALGPISEHYYFYHGKAWGDTSVWPDDPLIRVKAVFSDPPDDRPAYLVVSGFGSKYVLPNGLRLGSSLAEVEKLNGRPFVLRGMAQDDAGEVLSWCGGEIERALPGVKVFFRPLQDLTEGLTESELEQVCLPLSRSDASVWKHVYVETGKIQVARPVERLAPSGPEFGPLEEVAPSLPPASAPVNDDFSSHRAFYPCADGLYGVLLETPADDGTYSTVTTMSLLRRSGDGYEIVMKRELSFAWKPLARLTVLPVKDGGPERELFLADTGSLFTALHLRPQQDEVQVLSFSLTRAEQEFPGYRLLLNDEARPEIRQVWKFDDGEPRAAGTADFTWNGEFFCFPDGSKLRQ